MKKKRVKRGKEKEENETVTAKRNCDGCFSVEASEILSQGRDLESCGDLSWEDFLEKPEDLSDRELVSCERVRVVLDVTDVLVSPSSVVTEFCDVSSMCSDREHVEQQSSTFSKNPAHCCTDTQEEMRCEGSPVKAPPLSRRRMTPLATMQNSYTSIEREQGSYEGEGRGWNVRERTIIARTRQFLERSYSVKVTIEELVVSWDQWMQWKMIWKVAPKLQWTLMWWKDC